MTNERTPKFADFAFPHAINELLADMGYAKPTPVQSKAIPLVLEGRDLLATAQTGTGKTAAFALPLLARMMREPDPSKARPVLIVAPTRELAEQTGAFLEKLLARTPYLRISVIIGGTSYPKQIASLQARPSFVVGTPGRLLDQMELGHLDLSGFGALVIDEADRLLDMGFEPQMKRLARAIPETRQSLMFSATFADELQKLASKFLRDPARVVVGEQSRPIAKIKQNLITTSNTKKDETLIREIDKLAGSIIVFVSTKWKTEKIAKVLDEAGHEVARIHGDRTQRQRSEALASFRDGSSRILVATDVAARGLDVPHVAHVINYDLPPAPEDYVHRIGRTGRNGAEGNSLAFVAPEEMHQWAKIFKLINGKWPTGYKPSGGGPPAAAAGGSKRVSGAAKKKTLQNRQERRKGLAAGSSSSAKANRHRGGKSGPRTPQRAR